MRLLLSTRRKAAPGGEDGYILLMLLLIVALGIIAATAIVPTVKFQLERDREEEMIHRGVQYERAIKLYYKKFARYPTKLEDLENTNNLRFLRKRYKDPVTGKDFKLLHFGDVKLTFSGGIGGGTIPGASPIGSQGTSLNSLQSSGFGGISGSGLNAGSSFGQNQTSSLNPPSGDNSQPPPDASQSATPPEGQGTSPGSESSSGGGVGSISSAALGSQVFGGGPIVGVASTSKKTGYREFNHKKRYSEWQFIYDPGTDRGGLLTTPYQPSLPQGLQGMQNLNGQNPGSGPGNTFGTPLSGTPNNLNTPTQGGFGTSNQQNNPPQQQ